MTPRHLFALGKGSDVCVHCKLARRRVAVFSEFWSHVKGRGTRHRHVAMRLYRKLGGAEWSTWRPRCAR